MKKLLLYSEPAYLVANVLLSLAVAMLTAADFGVSMIVAPAYLVSQKFGFLTFGQSEYAVQAILFVVFCLLMHRVRPVYFASFGTCLIYGAALDGWRAVVPLFNPAVTVPGSMALPLRLVLFTAGMLLTSLSIALFFRLYLYPQVYDFFVKGISARFNKDQIKFKMAFDGTFLLISCGMTLLLFGEFVGIGPGTLIMTALNGFLIGQFGKVLDRCFVFVPFFSKVQKAFSLNMERS